MSTGAGTALSTVCSSRAALSRSPMRIASDNDDTPTISRYSWIDRTFRSVDPPANTPLPCDALNIAMMATSTSTLAVPNGRVRTAAHISSGMGAYSISGDAASWRITNATYKRISRPPASDSHSIVPAATFR